MRPSSHSRRSQKMALRAFCVTAFLRTAVAELENCTGTVSSVSDGTCDSENNLPACFYDGGDCCPSMCISTNTSTCTVDARQCLDPSASEYMYGEYNDCAGNLPRIQDGSCDYQNNSPSCGYDGGDCCPSTCAGSTCPSDVELCADPGASDFSFVGLENCTGYLPSTDDGRCDSKNNNPLCGYDGGDCCRCTCISSSYTCGLNTYDCIDPDATVLNNDTCESEPLSACSSGIPRVWVVEDSADAVALANSINCSGGIFDVEWNGNVTVEKTIWIMGGTVVNVTGANVGPVTADGSGNTRIFGVLNGSLYINDLVLTGGYAPIGGAILSNQGKISLARTSFNNNYAAERGGALFVFGSSNVSWSGPTSFIDNRANWDGGAIYATGSNVSWAGETIFSGNSVAGVDNKLGSSFGGAMSVTGGSSVFWSGETSFIRNRVVTGGDHVVLCNGGALAVGARSIVSWSGTTRFLGNQGCYCGGAVYGNDSSSVSWSAETSFHNNSAISGGAVCLEGSSNASWTKTTEFADNSATVDGGAMFVFYGSFASWSGRTTFINNDAQEGGSVHISDGSVLSWSSTTHFLNNTADHGGALFIGASSDASWTGRTLFNGNLAGSDGGAVFSSMPEVADLPKSNIYTNGPTTFSNNTALAYGGAVFMSGAVSNGFGLVPVAFIGNSAGSAGGAVFLSGVGIGPSLVGVTFTSNSAQVGGAVYTTGSGTTISAVSGEEFPTMYDTCTFEGNIAQASGGAIESAASKDLVINSTFVRNTAREGGALRLAGTAALTGCTFIENHAEERGGPAVSNMGVTSQIVDCKFLRNDLVCLSDTFLDFEEGDLYSTVCYGCAACDGDCQVANSTSVPKCTAAMEHTTCSTKGKTLSTIVIDAGYWRATESSRDVLECYNPASCLGGVTGAPGNCKEGYEGPYCAICSDGYAQSLAFKCNKCSGNRDIIFAALILPLAVALMGTFVAFLVSKEQECTGRGRFDRLKELLPLESIRIVIVAWQILLSFSSVADVTFPDVYNSLLDGVNFLNFDVGWVISTGCFFDLDFHDRLLMATIGPIAFAGLLGVTYMVARVRNRGSNAALLKVRRKHLATVLWMTFLIYSSVSSTVFQTFSCERLDDHKEYLRADYRIECNARKHKAFKTYAGVMIVLYPLGIPLYYATLLFLGRDAMNITGVPSDDDSNAHAAAYLAKPYRPGCYYYEVVECVRRILLTGAVVFVFPTTSAQIAVGLVIACAFSLVSEALAPYSSRWDSWVARMGHVIVLMSIFVGFLAKVDLSSNTSGNQVLFGGGLVALNALLCLAVVLEGLSMACSVTQHRESLPRAIRNAAVGFARGESGRNINNSHNSRGKVRITPALAGSSTDGV